MGAFFVYILKSAFCLAAFYLFYRLLLSRETFHRFNRMALFGLLVLSAVVPLVKLSALEPSRLTAPFIAVEEWLQTLNSEGDIVAASTDNRLMICEVLLLIYVIGVVVFLLRNVLSVVRLWLFLRKCERRKEDGFYIFTHDKKIAPFSWMRHIVLSNKDLEENGHAIVCHERAHAKAYHSIDLLVADVCAVLQWFNPAAWLLKQELTNIHEYEADASVIASGIDAKTYQLLLIKKAVGTRLYSMANSLNHYSLKNV